MSKYRNIAFYASLLSYLVSISSLVILTLVAPLFGFERFSNEYRVQFGFAGALSGIALQLLNYKEVLESKFKEHLGSAAFQYVGGSDKALKEMRKKIINAAFVRNTFVGIKDVSSQKAADIYHDWITGQHAKEWIEIVGPAQVFDRRYQLIETVPEERVRGEHFIYVIRHSTPIVNFIILDYSPAAADKYGYESEVYFGWVSNPKDAQRIFCSTHDTVVKTFKNYFLSLQNHRLWGDCVKVDYTVDKPLERVNRSDLVDKVGTWITLSKSSDGVETYGFFSLSIEMSNSSARRAGSMIIDGVLLDNKLNYIAKIRHNDEHISHYKNKIFVEYGDGTDRGRDGFCFYEFRRSKNVIGSENSDFLRGFFVDEGSWTRNLLFGCRHESKNLDIVEFRKKMAVTVLQAAKSQGEITDEQHHNALQLLPQ